MTDNEQPKPCPNCGGTDTRLWEDAPSFNDECELQTMRFCEDCGVFGPAGNSPEEADKRWNTLLRPADLVKLANYVDGLGGCGMDEPMLILAIRSAIKELAEKHTTTEPEAGKSVEIVSAGVGEGHPHSRCDYCKIALDEDDAIPTATREEYLTLCSKCYNEAGSSVR